jgi:hypothetical protein
MTIFKKTGYSSKPELESLLSAKEELAQNLIKNPSFYATALWESLS